MSSPKFTGLGPALVTPFAPDGDINWKALEALVEMQNVAGVDFLVPCGTTGESPTLSHDEQIKIIEFVVKASGGRVPILAGTGSNSTREAVELTKRAKAAKADGALVVVPYYNKPTPAGQKDYFREIAKVGLPIVAYDIPGRVVIKMSAETILELAEERTIVGLKWASSDLNQLMDVIRNRPDGFTVLSGDDNLTLPLMALGGDGVISVVSNLIPGPMKKFIHNAREDDWDAALDWHYRLLELMRAMFITTNPIPVKTALSMIYPDIFCPEPNFRSPLVPMSKEETEKLSAIISKCRDNGLLPTK